MVGMEPMEANILLPARKILEHIGKFVAMELRILEN
jgi:hypothetical protein